MVEWLAFDFSDYAEYIEEDKAISGQLFCVTLHNAEHRGNCPVV